jgi:hypothetical protein
VERLGTVRPGVNIYPRCGLTSSVEIWHTERTHLGSVASIFSLSLLPSCTPWQAPPPSAAAGRLPLLSGRPPLRAKPLRPSAPAEAPPLDTCADRPPPHAGCGPSVVALRAQASGLDLQSGRVAVLRGARGYRRGSGRRGVASGWILTRCATALLCNEV